MSESTPESLARRLLAELPTVVDDPDERRVVAERIERALASGDGDAVYDSLVAAPRTRAWYAAAISVDRDVERVYRDLPGRASPLTVYYVCPAAHTEAIFPARPSRPPRCTQCDREMITER
ncbi:MAG: hypothetical protein ACR2GH_14800 [Pseudonocardia sp.]